ncbi:hypothetical protein N7468_002216 [Penicillium chermesinum]|uniref:Uncharacterized protein n=1 Tax=Penicillium chermesinum TaxID=63820 RepID=A0A9W9PI29_9EURO|nr:uncharacterized protein N7468_002216 [Penicillium chermesinum]KAJ5247233.1 hypothetical protein N7468_002216 [Penicillium chermesinum]
MPYRTNLPEKLSDTYQSCRPLEGVGHSTFQRVPVPLLIGLRYLGEAGLWEFVSAYTPGQVYQIFSGARLFGWSFEGKVDLGSTGVTPTGANGATMETMQAYGVPLGGYPIPLASLRTSFMASAARLMVLGTSRAYGVQGWIYKQV